MKILPNLSKTVVTLGTAIILATGYGCNKQDKEAEDISDYYGPQAIPAKPTEYLNKLESFNGRVELYLGAVSDDSLNVGDLLFVRGPRRHTLIFVDSDSDGATAERYWRLKGKKIETFLSQPSQIVHDAYRSFRDQAFRGLEAELKEARREVSCY